MATLEEVIVEQSNRILQLTHSYRLDDLESVPAQWLQESPMPSFHDLYNEFYDKVHDLLEGRYLEEYEIPVEESHEMMDLNLESVLMHEMDEHEAQYDVTLVEGKGSSVFVPNEIYEYISKSGMSLTDPIHYLIEYTNAFGGSYEMFAHLVNYALDNRAEISSGDGKALLEVAGLGYGMDDIQRITDPQELERYMIGKIGEMTSEYNVIKRTFATWFDIVEQANVGFTPSNQALVKNFAIDIAENGIRLKDVDY